MRIGRTLTMHLRPTPLVSFLPAQMRNQRNRGE